MAYGEVTTGALERGSVPDMNLCFPYEIPDKDRLECVGILNGYPS
ncbi:unnamed protein product [Chondrus crispus]|uniref:Uncharacterized protein n=1 Tax=Chondrus crispus TaxID=2769 RepID=R7QL41_CHOCR|nr:unnamed protein product [Chondrus crispus]CDF39237.1 unnamed protein product [Chondrus crispus]|eukprot:XP_005719148.1 unnamed protein product [Chondrus crispus]